MCPQALPQEQSTLEAYAAGLIGEYLTGGWRDALLASMGLGSQDTSEAAKRERAPGKGSSAMASQTDAEAAAKKAKVCFQGPMSS